MKNSSHLKRKGSRYLLIVLSTFLVAGSMYGFISAAGMWGDNQRLSDMGGLGTIDVQPGNPSVAYNPSVGQYLVVWDGTESDASSEQTRIYGQVISATTGLEVGANDFLIGEVPGTADPARDALKPAVAYNSIGNEYLVIWVGNADVSVSGTQTEVFGQRVATDGSLSGAVFQISVCGVSGDFSVDVGASLGYPIDLAYNATNNQYLVVWRCDDVGDGDSDGDGDVDGDDNGAVVDGEFEIFGRIINANGSLAGTDDFQISQVAGANGANTEYDAESPSAAWDSADNQYLVTWGADNATLGDGNREIFGQRLDASGAEIGPNDFQISFTNHAGGRDFAISDAAYNNDDDEYLVVWSGDIITDTIVEVYGQIFTETVNLNNSANFQVSKTGVASAPSKQPSIRYNTLVNEYLVIWQAAQTANASNNEYEIFGQLLSASGAESGEDDFRISYLGPDGNVEFDAEAETGLVNGGVGVDFYAAWYGQDDRDGQVQNENEIFGQLESCYAPGGETITVAGIGQYTSDAGRVIIDVTTQGSLTELIVECFPENHPNATPGIQTGFWWRITPDAGGYTVDLTLPYDSATPTEDKVCRYTGSGQVWDCLYSSNPTANSIERTGITQLSDWAVGDNVGPTAVTVQSLTARYAGTGAWLLVSIGMLVLGVAGLILLRRTDP